MGHKPWISLDALMYNLGCPQAARRAESDDNPKPVKKGPVALAYYLQNL